MSAEEFAADAIAAIRATEKAGEKERLRQIFTDRLENPLKTLGVELDTTVPPEEVAWRTVEEIIAYASKPPPPNCVRYGMASMLTGNKGSSPILSSINSMVRSASEIAGSGNTSRISGLSTKFCANSDGTAYLNFCFRAHQADPDA